MEYIFKFIILFAVLFIAYYFLLSRTSAHRFKRFFLLLIPVASAIIPIITVRTVVIESQPIPTNFITETIAVQDDVKTTELPPIEPSSQETIAINWWQVALVVFFIGVLVFLIRMTINLVKLRKQGCPAGNYLGYQVFSTETDIAPHSFWNRIYVSKDFAFAKAENQIVLDHEVTHLRQRHSLDVIYASVVVALLWFNPFIYFWKRAIINNHEYLADAAVLSKGIDRRSYRSVLLKFLNPPSHSGLANAINLADFKTRIEMMNQQTRPISIALRSFLLLLITGLLLAACGETKKEVIIDHAMGMPPDIDANMVYGIDFDPYVKTGTLEYNYIKYKYEVQDDYSIKMWTMDDEPVDIEKNQLHPMAQWDFSREVQSLKDDPLTEKRIADGTLKLQKVFMSNYHEKIPLSLEEFTAIDESNYQSISLYKDFEDKTEIYTVMLFEFSKKASQFEENLNFGLPLINVFSQLYEKRGKYVLENEASSEREMRLAINDVEQLGYNIDTLAPDGPTFYASKDIITSLDKLQPIYGQLVKKHKEKFKQVYSLTSLDKDGKPTDTITTVYNFNKSYDSKDPIYINSASDSGDIIIDGKVYTYKKENHSFKFFDRAGNEINWIKQGWDIREHLNQSDPSLAIINGIVDPEDEFYVNDLKVSQKEFLDAKEDMQDLTMVNNTDGSTLYSIHQNGRQVSEKSSQNSSKANSLPLGFAMINAFDKVYEDKALYFYENKKSNYDRLLQKFKSQKDLGVRIDTLYKNGPAFYAGKNLPKTSEELQHVYSALIEKYKKNNKSVEQKPKFALVEDYQFYVLNGHRGSGSFQYGGETIKYRFKNDLEREYFDANGKNFSTDRLKEMKFVAVPIWDASYKENDVKNSSLIKDYFKKGKAVLFDRVNPEGKINYTQDYDEFLDTDFNDAFLEMYFEHGDLKMNLIPISWKKTNPAYISFFKRDNLE